MKTFAVKSEARRLTLEECVSVHECWTMEADGGEAMRWEMVQVH